jgi:hypothetical protein
MAQQGAIFSKNYVHLTMAKMVYAEAMLGVHVN